MTPLRSLTRPELLEIAEDIMVRCHLLSCYREGMKEEDHQMHVKALWEVGQMLNERLRGELVQEHNAEIDRIIAMQDAAHPPATPPVQWTDLPPA